MERVKKIWNSLNIAAKLILAFSFGSVIPLIASSFILYQISARELEESMKETTSIFSSQIASDMDALVKDYDSLTRSILMNDELMQNLSTDFPISQRIKNKLYYREMITRLMTMEQEILSVTILNEKGEYYQYNRNGKSIDYETLMVQPWLLEQINGPEALFVSCLHDCSYYDRDKDQIMVTVGRKVYDFGGRYAGMILIDLSPASLVKLSDEFLLERNQYNIKIHITNASGGLIYDSDLSSGRINYSEIDKESLLMYQKDPQNYLVIENTTEQLGMKVKTVIPHSKMFLRISFIQKVTVVLVIFLILMIAAVSVLFSGDMVKRIRNLQKNMKRLEEGKYELIEEPAEEDEIGSLVKSYNHMVVKMKSLIEDIYIAGIRQKNAQFLALRTQINPHFLFNTLESIRVKAILNGDDDVAEMIKLLAKMFRTVLDSDKKNHCVRDEMESIRSYIQLQNVRFDHKITLEEKIAPEIYTAKIMPILFQPVVENSFKYGSKESGVPIRISISGILTKENQMIFTISDDGVGMSAKRLKEVREELLQEKQGETSEKTSSRIGLRNITERLRLRYGKEGSLTILSSDEKGTAIEIRVPYTE